MIRVPVIRNLRWYYLLAFFVGGIAVVAVAYFILRASGLIYRLTNNSKTDWVESGE